MTRRVAVEVDGLPVLGFQCRNGHHSLCRPIDVRGDGEWPIRVGTIDVWCSCECHAVERDGPQERLSI